MSQQNIAAIPTGLAQVLSAANTINPVTPQGTPSVAANVLAQAGQAPGIAAIGQQAQAALPSVEQNAQDDQARKTLEAANRASRPAGIAGLNPNIGQYAEGGVVGYSGKDESLVKTSQAEEDRETLKNILGFIQEQALLPAGAAIADVATAIPRGLAGAYNSTVVRGMRAAGLPAAYLPDIMGGDYSSATPFFDKYVGGAQPSKETAPKEKAPAAAPAPAAAGYTSGNADLDNMVRALQQAEDPAQRAAIASGIQRLMGQGAGASKVRATMPPSAEGATTQRSAQRTAAAPAPTGQAPQLDEAQIGNLANKYLLKSDLSGLKSLVEQQDKLYQDRPNYEADKLRAINEAYQKEKDSRAWNRFIGGLEAPYRGIGSFYTNFEAKSREADLANALKQTEMPQAYRDALLKEMGARVEAAKIVPGIEAQYASPNANILSHIMSQVGGLQREDLQRQANIELERMRENAQLRAERLRASLPGETERIIAEYNRLLKISPDEAEKYLGTLERVKGAGKGGGEKLDLAEMKAVQSSLERQLKDYSVTGQRRQELEAQLLEINKELAKRSGLPATAGAPSGAVTPKTQAEFDALPKGSRYINPADGKEYIKN